MNIATVLEMAADAMGDRVALGGQKDGLSYAELYSHARAGAAAIGCAEAVLYVGQSGPDFATAFFASAWAGVPFVPLNYRLGADQLAGLVGRYERPLLLVDKEMTGGFESALEGQVGLDEWHRELRGESAPSEMAHDAIAALHLFTSGTSSAPKAAVLRHDNLSSYITSTVEFASADASDAALVSVPPYHIAGVANLLSNVFAGRRIFYLPQFTPETWLATVAREHITQAMVVPTMLARIVDALAPAAIADTPTLRAISYGGARLHESTLRRALEAFPNVGFVNAYGLTETSSTIAVLGPDDHRLAMTSGDERHRRRLASVGRVLPGIEVQVRDGTGKELPIGTSGDVWVRGDQVSGQYVNGPAVLDADGWFPTRDAGWVDSDGYLFIEGRTDDTIIRGGENIAPAEVEDALLKHPAVAEVAVVGLPDVEWGQVIVAAVVLVPGHSCDESELVAWSRQELRSSKAVQRVIFRGELPYTDTGKVLRRVVLAELENEHLSPA